MNEPTNEELREIDWAARGSAQVHRIAAGRRALFTAGLALGEQKQAARVRELEQRVADLKFALGDGAGWFDRYKRAESELAATKARAQELEDGVVLSGRTIITLQDRLKAEKEKLAVVERELDEWASWAESLTSRVEFKPLGERTLRERIDAQADALARMLDWETREHERHHAAEAQLRSELASARRVVEAAKHWQAFDDVPEHERRAEFSDAETALSRAVRALVSAGTDADRTEAPKSLREQAREKLAAMSDSQVSNLWVRLQHLEPEAPRSEAGEHDWYRGFDGAYHSHDWHCAHCGEGRNGSEPDARGCKGRPKPTEEPKPEPQPRCNAPEPSASVARSEVESGGKP